MQDFSPRNLLFIRSFTEVCPERVIVQEALAQLPWGHVIRLLQRVKEPAAREYWLFESEHRWPKPFEVAETRMKEIKRANT
jgi:hypothetical protein